MIARIPLDRIDHNPYQTRTVQTSVTDLMASILDFAGSRAETSGLIHVPVGRVVLGGQVVDWEEYGGVLACLGDEPEARVQLAAGHRRWRAFRQLADAGPAGMLEYGTFPVDVDALDDEAMASIAWVENEDRENVSVIEQAMAIARVIKELGWTQGAVGERWGMTQGAVSNKLRLLRLPEVIRSYLLQGWLMERHGRALLPVLALNPSDNELVKLVRRKVGPACADDFLTVAELEAAVKAHVEARTFKIAWVLSQTPMWGAEKTCADCEHLVRFGRQKRCSDRDCFKAQELTYRATVTGPKKAKDLHAKFSGWKRELMTRGWQRCEACERDRSEIADEGQWYTAQWRWVCPQCWMRAELPEPELPQAEEIAAAPIARGGEASTATAQPVMRKIEPAEPPEPPPPPATLVTARILPGETLVERRVMVAIAEEGRPPATFRTGWFGDLADLVAEVCVGHFGDGDISQEIVTG